MRENLSTLHAVGDFDAVLVTCTSYGCEIFWTAALLSMRHWDIYLSYSLTPHWSYFPELLLF